MTMPLDPDRKPAWTQDDYNDERTKMDRITSKGTARARIVQAEIDGVREHIHKGHGGAESIALLASYDAEMDRLCELPGVMHALYGDPTLTETA